MDPYHCLQLLPHLYDIALQSQKAGNPVAQKLQEVSRELQLVLEQHIQVEKQHISISM